MCASCAKEGRHVAAAHVHHMIDLADAPELALTYSNLESLCHPCHSRETLKRLREERHERDSLPGIR
ncbi:HNH endonuclease [Paludisphaera rhizosphaerae]|uniref:HNH endonuclease n=1 Tax=Paludisphaera rhizosphaerae TaxID=2711216 RepID=UPI0038992341